MLTYTEWWQLFVLVLCIEAVYQHLPYNTMCLTDRCGAQVREVNLSERVGRITNLIEPRAQNVFTRRAKV